MSIVDSYREKKITPEDCLSGQCDCNGADNCKFTRCKNCDLPVMQDGKAFPLVDYWHYAQYHKFECPICGGLSSS